MYHDCMTSTNKLEKETGNFKHEENVQNWNGAQTNT